MDGLSTLRSAVAMLVIVAMHLLSSRIERAAGARLRMLLSVAGGIAVGYVFVGLLPKIGVFTAKIVAAEPASPEFTQYRLYLLSLAGLLLYFAADRFRAGRADSGAALAIHSAAFAGYNALVGYLLAHTNVIRSGYVPHVLLASVMALHLFAMNHQLRELHGAVFDRALRWLFAAAAAAGWLAGVLLPVSNDVLAAWSAVLAGGILVNVFNEELPRERHGQVPAFLAGVAIVVAVAALFRTLSKSLG
jgi:hypothetical protein